MDNLINRTESFLRSAVVSYASMLLAVSLSVSGINPPEIDNKIHKIPVQQEVGEISGYYTCRGEESGGKTYTGVVAIARKGDVYVVSWTIGVGPSFTGIGIRQGNILAVSWAVSTEKGIMKGINLYRIDPGPCLTGKWVSVPGNGREQKEDLKFLAPLVKEQD